MIRSAAHSGKDACRRMDETCRGGSEDTAMFVRIRAMVLRKTMARNSNGAASAAPLRVLTTLPTWKTGKVCYGLYSTRS